MFAFFARDNGFTVVPLGFLPSEDVKSDVLEREASNGTDNNSGSEFLKSKTIGETFFGDLGTPGGSSISTWEHQRL